jgi:putative two-component system response regulator
MRCVVELGVAGHPWAILCAPTPEFIAAHKTHWPTTVLVIGLVFTFTVAVALWTNMEHAAQLEDKVAEQTLDVRNAQEEVLFRLASASQWCDVETPMHLRRVGLASQVLARANGWYGEDVEAIRQAAPMHDIGRIGIPDAILQKTDPLTTEEEETLRTHTRIGAEILGGSNVPMLKMAKDIALAHHERWDGKGYPRGLVGENIPQCARMTAIVDAYDTLTHDSVGHAALSEKEALAVMQQESGKQFDPELLAEFFGHLPEIRRIMEQNPDRFGGNRNTTPEVKTAQPTGVQFPAPDSSSNHLSPV